MRNLLVVLPIWLWRVYFQNWQKGFYFVISAQKYSFCQFLVINWAKMWIFTFKVSMLKLTGYPSSLQWYAKLGVGITGLAVACIFPKHEKMTVICHQRSERPILLIFANQLQILWIFTFKVSFQKLTGYPSSLQKYVKLGSSTTNLAVTSYFPKVTKNTVFCH